VVAKTRLNLIFLDPTYSPNTVENKEALAINGKGVQSWKNEPDVEWSSRAVGGLMRAPL
jgi:16S rRNA G966 N2-methylase RsmD